jgi:uncharacterized membrane protein YhdT
MQSNTLLRLVLSLLAYVGGRALYVFFTRHHLPGWNEIPGILESWLFFAITYWILQTVFNTKQGGRNA